MPASPKSRPAPPPVITAQLACGCQVGFRRAGEGAPVLVLVERKSTACPMAMHVAGLPIYDHREALRPPTRLAPPAHPDYEES